MNACPLYIKFDQMQSVMARNISESVMKTRHVMCYCNTFMAGICKLTFHLIVYEGIIIISPLHLNNTIEKERKIKAARKPAF